MNPNIKFGFSVATTGQRNTVSTPELVVLSNRGGFRITPQVSKKLALRSGDYVFFINNHEDIRAAVEAQTEFAVAACEALSLDINDVETAVEALIREHGKWALCKGIQLFDSKGIAQKAAERLSEQQRKAIVSQNFEESLAAAMENEELRDALTAEGITTEEQVQILADAYVAPQVDKFLGSKCANPSKTPGVGVTLTFSDATIWSILRGETANEKGLTRHFVIDLNSYGKVIVNNGYEDVEVPYVELGEYTDEHVVARGKADEE